MKKDIPIHKVEDLAVAVAPKEDQIDKADLWDVYLLNFKSEPIEDVLINSRGYGEVDGKEMETTQFRFYFEKIEPKSIVQVEQIQQKLFEITNEFWVSFKYDGYMYDKKYVFVRGSIREEYFTDIPYLGRKGVMIK